MKQYDRRRIYSFCLNCRIDIEDMFGYIEAEEFDFCPYCGNELVEMPREVVEWEYIENHLEYCKDLTDILSEVKNRTHWNSTTIAEQLNRTEFDVETILNELRYRSVVGTFFKPIPRTYGLTALGEEILKRLTRR